MEAFIYGFILGTVEGLTEFLPVSSTGHLIIASYMLMFGGSIASTFEVVIQLGAILAVVVLYWKRFWGMLFPQVGVRFSGLRGIYMLALTTIPPGLVGLLAHGTIKSMFNPMSVVWSLAVGALCMLAVEERGEQNKLNSLDELTPKFAFLIGCCQCFALWPGFSRSAATIMGGMLLGARRKVAAEYSFLAAVPLMCAASAYDLYKNWHFLSTNDLPLFGWGLLFSFIFALIAIKTFIALLSKVSLRPFAIYRLLLAGLVFYLLTY